MAIHRLRGYYQTGIARLTYDWDSLPPGEEYLDSGHLYAGGLNLFGRGSLYQLICSARTRAGKDKLARWMKSRSSRRGGPRAVRGRAGVAEPRGSP